MEAHHDTARSSYRVSLLLQFLSMKIKSIQQTNLNKEEKIIFYISHK
jgi:hypothetical protein